MIALQSTFENLAAPEIESRGFTIVKISHKKLFIEYQVILPNGESGKIALDKPKLKLYNTVGGSRDVYQPLLD